MRILKNFFVNIFLVGIMMMVILLCCSSQVQAAQDEDYTYTVTDGKAEITGYTGAGGVVTMPSTLGGAPVTSIGRRAFGECTSLTSISISPGVTSIDQMAFYLCTGLKSISIPQGVTSIGYNAFDGCRGLTSITVDANNLNYASINGVLYNKTGTCLIACPEGLTTIDIPQVVTSIGKQAFNGCRGLTSISLPQGITSIGDRAFANCSGLTSIGLPQGVSSIGDSAFINCRRLTTIAVADDNLNYASINGVLYNRTGTSLIACPGGLTTISIPQRVTSIGNSAFSYCSGLTSISLPQGVISIGEWVFLQCTGLNSISIPESVTSIGYGAFCNCEGLTSISIPQGVTSIGSQTFSSCEGLTSISIPESVTSIGDWAFEYCTGLTSITFNSATTTISDKAATIPATTKIIGYAPSTAKDYATKYNRTFEVIDAATSTLQSIAITTPATKLNYTIGDPLDITGLVVTGTYSDGSTKIEPITAANITGFNSVSVATDQVLTISVYGKTVSFTVQILDPLDTNGMTEIKAPSTIVNPDKVWTIKLNGLVNESSLNGKIYVTNAKGIRQQITCKAKVVDGISQIEVKPDKNYDPGDYMLWVRSITSTKGIGIKKQVFLKFTVNNLINVTSKWAGTYYYDNKSESVTFTGDIDQLGDNISGILNEPRSSFGPNQPYLESTIVGTIINNQVDFVKTYAHDNSQIIYTGTLYPNEKVIRGTWIVQGSSTTGRFDIIISTT